MIYDFDRCRYAELPEKIGTINQLGYQLVSVTFDSAIGYYTLFFGRPA